MAEKAAAVIAVTEIAAALIAVAVGTAAAIVPVRQDNHIDSVANVNLIQLFCSFIPILKQIPTLKKVSNKHEFLSLL